MCLDEQINVEGNVDFCLHTFHGSIATATGKEKPERTTTIIVIMIMTITVILMRKKKREESVGF